MKMVKLTRTVKQSPRNLTVVKTANTDIPRVRNIQNTTKNRTGTKIAVRRVKVKRNATGSMDRNLNLKLVMVMIVVGVQTLNLKREIREIGKKSIYHQMIRDVAGLGSPDITVVGIEKVEMGSGTERK